MMFDNNQAHQQRKGSWRVQLGTLTLALLPLSAQAIAECSATASGAVFGGYTFSNTAPTYVVGNVQVSCSLTGILSQLVSYDISLSTGTSTSYAPRKMVNGANWLIYNLYKDASKSVIWGNGISGTSIVSDRYLVELLTTVRNYAIYGQIPAGQNVPAGIYSDTIVVTVNY
jgi:spore coat protein U-like protein